MKNITVLIKPASYLCNLKCSYCFYLDEAESRKHKSATLMTNETAINVIDRVYDYTGEEANINFMFQGGEPLLAGSEFFEFFSDKAIKSNNNSDIRFSVQTNGTLIDKNFCRVFAKYNYLIGVSIDGPENIHNSLRNDSFKQAMNGINKLKANNIDFNILSVVTDKSDANELFAFYSENQFSNVQIIYCLESFTKSNTDYSSDPFRLARFKKRFFNCWLKCFNTDNYIYVREFENLIIYIKTGQYEQCGMFGKCTPQLVIESDGTVYPCDFYCLDKFNCGNINTDSIDSILASDSMKTFVFFDTEKNTLCGNCDVYRFCYGGCKRYRNLYNKSKGYCPQQDFLRYAVPKILRLEGNN